MGMQAPVDVRAGVPTRFTSDPLSTAARWFFLLSLFFSSLLVVRLGALTLGDICLLASIALAALAGRRDREERTPAPFSGLATTLLACAVVVAGCLSSMDAEQQIESTLVVARLILLAFALPWVARVVLPNPESLRRAVGWTAAGAAFAASGTLLQYAFGSAIIPGAEVTQAGRFPGWTGHVSDLGGVTAMGIALCLGFVISGRTISRVWGIVAIALLLIGLILSGSVSGMIASSVAILIYLVRGALKIRYIFLIAAVLVGVYFLASSVQSNVTNALDPMQRLLQTLGITEQGRYSTTETRIETSDAAFATIGKNPFVGVGLDPISAIADGQFPVHNLFLGALFQGGVLLAIALLVLTLRPILGHWRKLDRSMVTTQILAATTTAVVFAMTAPSLYNRYFWVPIALLCVARALQLFSMRSIPSALHQ